MTNDTLMTENGLVVSGHGSECGTGIGEENVIDTYRAGPTPSLLDHIPARDVSMLADEAGVDPASLSDVQIMEALFQMR